MYKYRVRSEGPEYLCYTSRQKLSTTYIKLVLKCHVLKYVYISTFALLQNKINIDNILLYQSKCFQNDF